MRSHMTSRTRAALLAGLTLIVAGGAGAVYVGSRGSTPAPTVPKVQAYVAQGPVAAGTAGASAVAQGLIATKQVAPEARPANGVTDPSQLNGKVAREAIPAGALITTDMFPDPQTRIGTVNIPTGKRALALEMSPVPGIAGFAGTGDRIDVYGIAKDATGIPTVRLVLQGVDVLNVNGAGLPSAQGQPGSANLIYLVAVLPSEAERLIYLNEFEKLYFDLVPKGEGPVKTPGAGPASALAVV